MKNKRGQFYILAAILIVTILTGLTTMSTYTITKPKARAIDSMHAELKEEGFRIIDYGVKNGNHIASGEIEGFLKNDYGDYFLKKTDNSNVFVLFGFKCGLGNNYKDESNFVQICPSEYLIFLAKYESLSSGSITAKIGAANPIWGPVQNYVTIAPITPTAPNQITVTLQLDPTSTQDYTFDLRDNQMFYFVMIQDKEGERYIVKDD